MRDEDEELFDINPTDYIRRDTEGSDSDTRRRAAADLVKSLTERFPEQVTQLCTTYVQVGAAGGTAAGLLCLRPGAVGGMPLLLRPVAACSCATHQ